MKVNPKNLKPSRKQMMLIVGAVVLVLLVAYAALSAWTWSQYKGSYTGWQGGVKSRLDLAMGMPVVTTDQKAKWVDTLDMVATITAEPSKCDLNGVYSWQQSVVPLLKKDVNDCQKDQASMKALHDSLVVAVKSIRSEEAIAGILGEPLKVTTVDETAYQAEIDAWSKAETLLAGLDVPNEAAGVKAAAILAAKTIKTAWNGLMVANTAQNASQYQTALNELSQAYTGLSNVSQEGKKVLQSAGDAVQKAYNSAF